MSDMIPRKEELEREKLAGQDRLRGLFVRLSDEVSSSEWAPSIGGRTLSALNEREEQLGSMLRDKSIKDENDRERARIRALLDDASEKADEASQRLTEKYKILGAILFEQKNAGMLPSEITILDEDMAELAEIRQDQGKGFFRKIFRNMDKNHFDRSRDEKYYRYGTALFDNGQEDLLSGENALRVTDEIKELRNELSYSVKDIEALREELENVVSSELDAKDEDIDEARRDVWALAANNGQYLYENAERWIGEDTPSSVLDVIAEILQAERDLVATEEKLRALSDERKKDEIRLLIEENRRRVTDLRNEKKMLDEKIMSLEKEIERMEELIRG